MLKEALVKVEELLNDKSLKILTYSEYKDYYLFGYGTQDGEPIFDNCMIKVDKKSNKASYYIITDHLDEVVNKQKKKK